MVLTVLGWSAAVGRPYYLSSSEGDDLNPGTLQSPWKTLEKISGVSLRPAMRSSSKRATALTGILWSTAQDPKGSRL